MNECKYCSGNVSCLPIASKLRYIENGDNYGLIELNHSSNQEDFKPNIRFEVCVDKVSRLKLDINYCPMCGRKL